MPSAYYLSPRFCPRSSTTTESDVRVAISFAIVKPAHPPPAITTSTGFSRVIAALPPDPLPHSPILDLDCVQAPIRRIHRDPVHVIEFCWNSVPQTQPFRMPSQRSKSWGSLLLSGISFLPFRLGTFYI